MQKEIFNEFIVHTQPATRDRKSLREGSPSYKVPAVEVFLTHKESGASTEFEVIGSFANIDIAIENAICKFFPNSRAFTAINFSRKNYEVELDISTLSLDRIGECFHTALRKLCDGPDSSFWWTMLHDLPSPVRGTLWEELSLRLTKLGPKAKLKEYIETIRLTFKNVMDDGYFLYARASDMRHLVKVEILQCKTWDLSFLDDAQKPSEMERRTQICSLAKMAVAYLADDTIEGMLGYSYKKESKNEAN